MNIHASAYLRMALLLAVFCAFIGPAPSSAGEFDGAVALGYATRDEKTRESVDRSTHFFKRYSLFYGDGGTIMGGRVGSYRYGFGYSWVDLDGRLNGQSTDDTADKILYDFDFKFRPVNLPFKLHAFSRDLSGFRTETSERAIGRREIMEGISELSQRHTGLSLEMGIRNGSYLGRYREYLSNFPRLFVDYSEIETKGRLPGGQRFHTLNREIGFVSLNKVDNWIHYRINEHENRLNPDQDLRTETIILGTIDQHLSRRWINLTNWIRVSADMTLETQSGPRRGAPLERTDINLFTRARHLKWKLYAPANFSREMDKEKLLAESGYNVPLFASGDLTRNTGWTFRGLLKRDVRRHSETAVESRVDRYEFESVLSLLRTRMVGTRVKGRLVHETDGTTMVGAGVEALSQWGRSRNYSFFSAYDIRHHRSEMAEGEDRSYLLQELTLSGTYNVDNWRFGVTNELGYGRGDQRAASVALSSISDEGGSGSGVSRIGESLGEGNLWEEELTVYAEHFRGRLRNRIEYVYSMLDAPQTSESRNRLTHAVAYASGLSAISASTLLSWGDLGNAGDDDPIRYRANHNLRFSLASGREWEAISQLELELGRSRDGSERVLDFNQALERRWFTYGFLPRKIFGLKAEYDLSDRHSFAGVSNRNQSFSLVGSWYPTRVLSLRGTLGYGWSQPSSSALNYALEGRLTYSKLRLRLSYEYGRQEVEDETYQLSHFWEMHVERVF